MSGAVLSVATAAAGVKAALASPVSPAVVPELNQLKQSLDDMKQDALEQSGAMFDQAQAQLVGGVIQRSPAAQASPQTAGHLGDSALRQDRRYPRSYLQQILREAAVRHHLDPKLVLALSYWESAWDQSKVSETGAVGVMQVQPESAKAAGPALLGRSVDIHDPHDNADVGCALLKENFDNFGDAAHALAAYYQGPTSLRQHGMYRDTRQYVEGILSLAARMSP